MCIKCDGLFTVPMPGRFDHSSSGHGVRGGLGMSSGDSYFGIDFTIKRNLDATAFRVKRKVRSVGVNNWCMMNFSVVCVYNDRKPWYF